jgi:putative ABC transport system substrate-binding protein
MNLRRKVLQALGAGTLGAAFPAIAQAQVRIGWISNTRAADANLFLDALRSGLKGFGYVEGRNLLIDARWGDDVGQKIEQNIADLIAARPSVIVTQGPAAQVLRRHTATIPIVFGYSGDPVEAGMVKSFAHPGGNLTGIAFLTLELVGKRVQLLKETLPKARRLAVVANPQHPGDTAERRISERAAAELGISIDYFEARSGRELLEVLPSIEKARSDAVMFFPVQFVISHRERIAEWAVRNRLPAISGWSQFADGGNLLTYGPNLDEVYRRLSRYVDRILKGAKPADLPVELPTRVELVVNVKAAKALGVTVPRSVLVRADRVIE